MNLCPRHSPGFLFCFSFDLLLDLSISMAGGSDMVVLRDGPRFTSAVMGNLTSATCPPGGEFNQTPFLPMVLNPQEYEFLDDMCLWSHLTTSPAQKVLHRNMANRLCQSAVQNILSFVGNDCQVFILTIRNGSFDSSAALFGERVNVDRIIMPTFSTAHARILLNQICFGHNPARPGRLGLRMFMSNYEDVIVDRYDCMLECMVFHNQRPRTLLLLEPVTRGL